MSPFFLSWILGSLEIPWCPWGHFGDPGGPLGTLGIPRDAQGTHQGPWGNPWGPNPTKVLRLGIACSQDTFSTQLPMPASCNCEVAPHKRLRILQSPLICSKAQHPMPVCCNCKVCCTREAAHSAIAASPPVALRSRPLVGILLPARILDEQVL